MATYACLCMLARAHACVHACMHTDTISGEGESRMVVLSLSGSVSELYLVCSTVSKG